MENVSRFEIVKRLKSGDVIWVERDGAKRFAWGTEEQGPHGFWRAFMDTAESDARVRLHRF